MTFLAALVIAVITVAAATLGTVCLTLAAREFARAAKVRRMRRHFRAIVRAQKAVKP